MELLQSLSELTAYVLSAINGNYSKGRTIPGHGIFALLLAASESRDRTRQADSEVTNQRTQRPGARGEGNWEVIPPVFPRVK